MTLRDLASRLRGLKAGTRHGQPVPKVRPALLPEDRDIIVTALEQMADRADLLRSQ